MRHQVWLDGTGRTGNVICVTCVSGDIIWLTSVMKFCCNVIGTGSDVCDRCVCSRSCRLSYTQFKRCMYMYFKFYALWNGFYKITVVPLWSTEIPFLTCSHGRATSYGDVRRNTVICVYIIYVYVHTHTHIYIYIYIYTHTYRGKCPKPDSPP
jgi:hypothetical protein